MGFTWYEIDLTYWLILLLKITGYATEIIQCRVNHLFLAMILF
jgi:fatty-acid desaturase